MCTNPIRAALALTALIAIAAGPAWAKDNDNKIDTALLLKLADDADATAPLFVVFAQHANVKTAQWLANRAERARAVVAALQADSDSTQAGARAWLRANNVVFRPFWVENKIYVPRGTLNLARALAARPEVIAIVPEQVYQLPRLQRSAPAAVEWNIGMVKADQVWAMGVTGAGSVVANNDSGVQYTHPALDAHYRGKTEGGYNHTGNWHDPGALCPGAEPCDGSSHGTHTMGTMVGDDPTHTNQIGMAPGAKWIACRGCEGINCPYQLLIACAQWFMAPDNDPNLHPDVVNCSWSAGSGNTFFQSYVQNWRAAGIFPAFSAGNDGPRCGTAHSPGDYPESFASGAVESNGAVAGFSSRGPSQFGRALKPNVTAPGVGIRSSIPMDDYDTYDGTSMASPHSAGLVALIWSGAPAYRGNISATDRVISSTATGLTAAQNCGGVPGTQVPNNTYGYGLIDALAAVKKAQSTPPGNPPVVAITAPVNGAEFDCGTPVAFTATAQDPEEGNIAGKVQWIENGASFGSGAAVLKTYTCTELGPHSVVASVTDNSGLTDTATITIKIVNDSMMAPMTLRTSVSGPTVTLSWTDMSNNEDSFVVERKKFGADWTAAISLPTPSKPGQGDTVTTTDTPGSGLWQYRVRAANAGGVSNPSNIALAAVR